MALQHCRSSGITHLMIESDCQKAVDIINNKCRHFGYYNWTREIRAWMGKFQSITCQWIGRNSNKVADKLAKSIVDGVPFIFHAYVPLGISNLLHVDYVQSI